MPANALDVAVGLVAIAWFLRICIFQASSAVPLPPGPTPMVIAGNLRDMPQEHEWLTYTSWSRKFGEIVYVHVFGQPIIFLNSFRAAHDLLDKRGHIYSDRPSMPMLGDLMKYGAWAITIMPNGPKFRAHRRIFDHNFRFSVVKEYEASQINTTNRLLQRLLETPTAFREHAKDAIGFFILDLIYGWQTVPDDPYIALAEETARHFSVGATPGRWAVDTLPILKFVPKWFPGAEFRRFADKAYDVSQLMVNGPFEVVKDAMAKGTAKPCFCTKELEHDGEVDEQAVKNVAATAYGSGVETILSAICVFFLQMTLNPEIQVKAQEELDRVCGNRLPFFSDREALPYVESIILETYRWHPVTPQGIPHRLEQSDVFEGKRLPKGSIIIANLWGMCHDENDYPNPEAFNPTRYTKDGKVSFEGTRDPRTIAFGFGRRICPGRFVADSQLFLIVASILKVFKIEKPLGINGEVIEPSDKLLESGIVSSPLPFSCKISPRSAATAELIREIDSRQG